MTEGTVEDAYAKLAPLVGREGPEVSGTIYERDVARFARACGEDGAPGAHVAALLLTSVIESGAGPSLASLRADGTGVGREGWLPLDGLRLMGGGQDLEFHAPVPAGTEYVARPRLAEVTLKDGASGALVLFVLETEFRTAAGAPLVTCRETLIGR